MATDFVDVVLRAYGKDKMKVIQALRAISFREPVIKELDLAMASRLLENLPSVVVPNVNTEVGTRIKVELEKAGAVIELKPC